MEAFLLAKPLSIAWREMPSALEGRRSPLLEPAFQGSLDSESVRQAAGANRLPATWHQVRFGGRKAESLRVCRSGSISKSLVGRDSRVAFLNLVPTSP
jgi:hypothetical protein